MADSKKQFASNIFWAVLCVLVGAARVYFSHGAFRNVAWGIVLIVLGVFGIVVVTMKGRLEEKFAGMVPTTPGEAAEKISNLQKNLYSGLHEYRLARPGDFEHLDRAFYDEVTRQLTTRGYRLIRDEVNTTIAAATPNNYVVIRSMIGDQGTTTAFIYHLAMLGKPHVIKIVEFDSELDDGTFVTTANNAEFEKTLGYPFSDRLQFPSATPAMDVLEGHRNHLKEVLAGKPGVAPVLFTSYDELRASQDRAQILKNAHRNSPDFDHRAELQKIAGRPLRPHEEELAERVAENLQS